MGRHAVSSSLRTPAVLVGVPVATVLATFGTTAVLGGVVPSAEELPLRAEAPGDVAAGVGPTVAGNAPAAPVVSLDAPTDAAVADLPSAPGDRLVPAARTTTPAVADARPATGPRVVRVSPATVAPVRDGGPRVVAHDGPGNDDAAPDTGVFAVRPVASPAASPAASTAASTALPSTKSSVAGRSVGSRSVAAASPVESVTSPTSETVDSGDASDGNRRLVGVDSSSGVLSVLSFG